MGNVEFSKLGAAILRNKALTSHIVQRLSNITPQEEAAGEVEIRFYKGEEAHTLTIKIGPQKHSRKLQPA